jgi:hypothetical protein
VDANLLTWRAKAESPVGQGFSGSVVVEKLREPVQRWMME